MVISDETLIYYAEHYGITLSTVKRLYNLIKDVPCVSLADDSTFLYCLETLIGDRMSYLNAKDLYPITPNDSYKNHTRDIRQSMDYALYAAYEDAAIPYLSDEFIKQNRVFIDRQPSSSIEDDDFTLDFGNHRQ